MGHQKGVIVWEWVKTQSGLLTPPEEKAFENIVGTGKYAGNQHFHLFLKCFLLFPTRISIFESQVFFSLQML